MADWKQLEPAITQVVEKLPDNGYLALRNGGYLMQFAVLEGADARILRAEVCRDSSDDEPMLRKRGWELIDSWSGLWRRDSLGSLDPASVQALVQEGITAVRLAFGVGKPDGFTYLSWQEVPAKASWQVWKSGKDKDLTWADLGLPKGRDTGD